MPVSQVLCFGCNPSDAQPTWQIKISLENMEVLNSDIFKKCQHKPASNYHIHVYIYIHIYPYDTHHVETPNQSKQTDNNTGIRPSTTSHGTHYRPVAGASTNTNGTTRGGCCSSTWRRRRQEGTPTNKTERQRQMGLFVL